MFAVVDVETTGGRPGEHRIIEIAVLVHDGARLVDEFSTLVNPERDIPEWITMLTGIDASMVSSAPTFNEIARRVAEMTDGRIFVAHNARFDYGFLREQFKELGVPWQRQRLCTLRLSRKYFPGLDSYSLGDLCEALKIPLEGRHRARGDALATTKLLEMLMSRCQVTEELAEVKLPDHLVDKVAAIPEEPGVYYFHDASGGVVYIGKSVNLQQRVVDHFAAEANGMRATELKKTVQDVSFELTGSELIAMLREWEDVQRFKPAFNRAWKYGKCLFGLYQVKLRNGYAGLRVQRLNGDAVVAFSNRREAGAVLEGLVDAYHLCPKLCGFESCRGCRGACRGREPAKQYNERVERALEQFRFDAPNFFVIGRGRTREERSLVLVEGGRFLGFGYANGAESVDELRDCIQRRDSTPEALRILRNYLRKHGRDKILTF